MIQGMILFFIFAWVCEKVEKSDMTQSEWLVGLLLSLVPISFVYLYLTQ